MKHQHLQTAVLPAEVATAMGSHETTQRAIAKLQEFIALRPNAREVRKALVVKLVYQGYLYEEIQTILDVSRLFNNRLETSLRARWNRWTALES